MAVNHDAESGARLAEGRQDSGDGRHTSQHTEAAGNRGRLRACHDRHIARGNGRCRTDDDIVGNGVGCIAGRCRTDRNAVRELAGKADVKRRIALMAGRRVDSREIRRAGGHREGTQFGGNLAARDQRDIVSAQRGPVGNRDGDHGIKCIGNCESGDADAAAKAGRGGSLEPVSLAADDGNLQIRSALRTCIGIQERHNCGRSHGDVEGIGHRDNLASRRNRDIPVTQRCSG